MKKCILILLCLFVVYQARSQEKLETKIPPTEELEILEEDVEEPFDEADMTASDYLDQLAKYEDDALVTVTYPELKTGVTERNLTQVEEEAEDGEEEPLLPDNIEDQLDQKNSKLEVLESQDLSVAISLEDEENMNTDFMNDTEEEFDKLGDDIESESLDTSAEDERMLQEAALDEENLRKEMATQHCSKILSASKTVLISKSLNPTKDEIFAQEEISLKDELEGEELVSFISGNTIVFEDNFLTENGIALFEAVDCMEQSSDFAQEIANPDELSALAKVQISPNPTSSQFNLSFPEEVSGTYLITDMNGEVMLERELKQSEKSSLDLKSLGFKPGIYLVMIKDGAQTIMKKFILK